MSHKRVSRARGKLKNWNVLPNLWILALHGKQEVSERGRGRDIGKQTGLATEFNRRENSQGNPKASNPKSRLWGGSSHSGSD